MNPFPGTSPGSRLSQGKEKSAVLETVALPDGNKITGCEHSISQSLLIPLSGEEIYFP